MLSDHGQTQGATFKQRNGYGLDELVERSLSGGAGGRDRQAATSRARWSATRSARRRARKKKRPKNDVSDREVVVLGSGQPRARLPDGRAAAADARGDRGSATRELLPALREHPHVGWLLVRSARTARSRSARGGARYLADGRVEGEDPLAAFPPNAAHHLLRTDGFAHVADIMVGSFYDPMLDEGCAFEELISFHGGLGGPQTRPFLLYPAQLPLPDEPIVGAAAVHDLLLGWRTELNGTEQAAEPALEVTRSV